MKWDDLPLLQSSYFQNLEVATISHLLRSGDYWSPRLMPVGIWEQTAIVASSEPISELPNLGFAVIHVRATAYDLERLYQAAFPEETAPEAAATSNHSVPEPQHKALPVNEAPITASESAPSAQPAPESPAALNFSDLAKIEVPGQLAATDSAASEETASAPPNAKPETKPEAIPSPSLDFSALAQASPAPEATAAKPTATSAAESAAKPIAAAAEPASRMQPVTKIEPPPIPEDEEEKTRSLDFSKLLEEQTTPKSEATKSETAKSKAKSAAPPHAKPPLTKPSSTNVDWDLSPFTKDYDRVLFLEWTGSHLEAKHWTGNWKPNQQFIKPIEVNQNSIFKIAMRTTYPYHGHVVSNPTNDAFFQAFNDGITPEHVSIFPVYVDGNFAGEIVCATTKLKGEKVNLSDYETYLFKQSLAAA